MPTNTAPESGAPVSSETFVIAHPCKYEVCQRKNSKAANKQLFGLAANGQSSTPYALPLSCFPEGLRAVDNFPKLHTRTTKAEDTRVGGEGRLSVATAAPFFAGQKPGLAPAGEALFFVSPKKSPQKKGDPAVCVPGALCAPGQPAVLAASGVLLKLAFGSNSRKPWSAGCCAPRRRQTGGCGQPKT